MKKHTLLSVLTAILILAAAFAGCSAQPETEKSVDSSESVLSEAAEGSSEAQESLSESDETAPESSSSDEGTADDAASSTSAAPESSSDESGQVTGALVMNDGSIFGSAPEVLGTDTDLDAWNSAIAERGSIAGILVSTLNDERDLTADEIGTVLDTLQSLSPAVMDELGNPATGGATNVAAYDENGNRLWSVTLNGDWLIVQASGDDSRRILAIDEADAAPILDIAG